MFDGCNSMESLNETRLRLLMSGEDAISVNKLYEQRKSVILSGGTQNFKRVRFVPVPVPESVMHVGIDFAYEDSNCGIHVITSVMEGK